MKRLFSQLIYIVCYTQYGLISTIEKMNGIIYDSIKEASDALNISRNVIYYRIGRKSFKEYESF